MQAGTRAQRHCHKHGNMQKVFVKKKVNSPNEWTGKNGQMNGVFERSTSEAWKGTKMP